MQTNVDITLRYRTLCTLSISHDYFKDNEPKRLVIEPTFLTKMWLRNNRLIYRRVGTGFGLGYLDRDGDSLKKQKFEKEKLTFLISTTDVYFDVYSSYNFRKTNQIVYLNNSGQVDSLSKNEKVSNEDFISLYPSKFIYKISDNDDNKKATIKDYSMDSVWESSDENFLKVNLVGQEPGKFSIYQEDREIESFYLLPKVPRGLVTVVDLFMKDISFENQVSYKVNFGAEEAIWRYYFVQYKSNSVYMNMRVESLKKGEELPFTAPREVVIHSGQTAMLVESQVPILVQENSPHRFQLKAFKENTQERISIQLPTPTYRELTVDQETKQVVANVFMKI